MSTFCAGLTELVWLRGSHDCVLSFKLPQLILSSSLPLLPARQFVQLQHAVMVRVGAACASFVGGGLLFAGRASCTTWWHST